MGQAVRARIGLAVVSGMKPGDIVWDTAVRGFYAVGNADGSVTFRVKARVRGRQRNITIGKSGVWKPEKAREHANELLVKSKKGEEPAKHQVRGGGDRLSFKAAKERFLAQHGSHLKERTREGYEAILDLHLVPAFGTMSMRGIDEADAMSLHQNMAKTPRNANHALAVLSKMMNWAESVGLRDRRTNPCENIKRYKENKRKRYLSDEEYGRLGQVLDEALSSGSESVYVVGAIRVIIFTGARRNEILSLRWVEVDEARRVLNLDDSKTGSKSILLNREALDVIGKLPKVEGNPYVFVGERIGRHLVNIAKPWGRIRTAAGLADVRLHDLRHSFGNTWVDAGGSTRLLGGQLGHARSETSDRYAHAGNEAVTALVDRTGQVLARRMGQKRVKRPANHFYRVKKGRTAARLVGGGVADAE
jgi:integrase